MSTSPIVAGLKVASRMEVCAASRAGLEVSYLIFDLLAPTGRLGTFSIPLPCAMDSTFIIIVAHDYVGVGGSIQIAGD